MYILDTDHIGIIQRGVGPEFNKLRARVAAAPADLFYFPIVSFHEQVLGWSAYVSKARDAAGVARAYAMFERILADFAAARVLPFDGAAAGIFDSLRAQRVRVATMDLRIASIALAHGMTLLTRNLVDFRKVPSLSTEDWTA